MLSSSRASRGFVRRRRAGPHTPHQTAASLMALRRNISFAAESTATQNTHDYLSASQALTGVYSSRSIRTLDIGAEDTSMHTRTATALTFTLPPFCAWAASAGSGEDPAYTSRHALPRDCYTRAGGHYSSIWGPIESYVSQLDSAHLRERQGVCGGAVAAGGGSLSSPVCLSLRLFPDLSVAKLPAIWHTSRDARRGGREKEGSYSSPQGFVKRSQQHRRLVAAHEQPLEAILATEHLWGAGVDPGRVFRHALDGLTEIGLRFLPQLPLVLQLPTRLLVSQQFLEDLATLLVKSGWRSVAFELPSTHQLYASPIAGSSGATGTKTREVGAVDSAWCRLPLLCTPWPVLCRHPTLGTSLRQLRRHDVVPFHVLFSWAITEARLFQSVEHGVVVDTTAPLAGAEAWQATWQSPNSVGRSVEEAQRHTESTDTWPSRDEDHEEGRVHSNSGGADDSEGPSSRRIFVSDNPMVTRAAGVSLSRGVVDAVRRHGKGTDDATSAAAATLSGVERAWRRHQEPASSPSPRAPRSTSSSETRVSDAPLLILDAPPDHLRVLIEKSIQPSTAAAHPRGTTSSTATSGGTVPLHQLLQKVGQFMQHTLQHDDAAEEKEASNQQRTSSETKETGKEDDPLEREAAELEQLLQQANDADETAALTGSVEHMMAEMQRYMPAHAGKAPSSAAEGSASTDFEHKGTEQVCASNDEQALLPNNNPWSSYSGYWACMGHLLRHSTLIWTAPTYNVRAVRAWAVAYRAVCGGNKKKQPTPSTPASMSGAPVVPVWMPLQSAMRTEVERRLREGHHFPNPPSSPASLEAAGGMPAHPGEKEKACQSWLPPPLNEGLREALAQLPPAYQAEERRRLLRDYREVREGPDAPGGATSRRCASDITFAAAFSRADDDALHFRAGESPRSARQDDAGESLPGEATGQEMVRIRVRQGAQPFHFLSPTQVENMERGEQQAAVARATAATATSSTASPENAKALAEVVKEADAMFETKALEAYRDVAASSRTFGAHAVALYVPSPGLSATALRRSWRAIQGEMEVH